MLVLLVDDARARALAHRRAAHGARRAAPGVVGGLGPGRAVDPEVRLDEVDLGIAEAIARTLAPLRLAEGGATASAGSAPACGSSSCSARGASTRSTGAARRARARGAARADRPHRPTARCSWLDLKQAAEDGMGPHGVLVGATGSGKSELLRSLVAGLAATHDPEQLAFVLVDYKGGAAFADLSRLPHVAGMITNLQRDLSLVDRMRDALIGEQERRQTMLREAGNVDDIVAYQARREADPSLPPMPDLLVIVDEFAELLAARPEFIDLFVGLGRVGRSLGIHLLLSSQRLDEGRLRGLESHLRYRLCLRTYSATESKLVLGTPDAYLLPSLPGPRLPEGRHRAATSSSAPRSSSGPYEPPPSTRGRAAARARVRRRRASRRRAGGAAAAPAPGAAERAAGARRPPRRRAASRSTRSGSRRCRRPSRSTPCSSDAPWWRGGERAEGLRAAIGRLDRPAEQRTEPFDARPRRRRRPRRHRRRAAHRQEHAAAHARRRADPGATPRRRLQLYGIDLGGGLLDALDRRAARRRRRRQARPRGDPRASCASCAPRSRTASSAVPRAPAGSRMRDARADADGVPGRRPARRRLGGVQARVRGPRPRGRGARRRRPELRRPRRGRGQPLGRDPAGAARQPRLAARAAAQRRDRLARLARRRPRRCPPTSPAAA